MEMICVEKTVKVNIYTWGELSRLQQKLFIIAARHRVNAQAPHSHYKVGAAVLMEGGKIFPGVNLESCSWTQTTHAEQTAISSGITVLGASRVISMTVIGAPERRKILLPPPPRRHDKKINYKVSDFCPSCGHCLQIICENCFKATGEYDPDVQLWGYNGNVFYQTTISDALPMPFLPQHLGVNLAKYRNQNS